MTSRLWIKFPTPYAWGSNSPPPGRLKWSNARGMPGGVGGGEGVLKLRFKWYIILIQICKHETSITLVHVHVVG